MADRVAIIGTRTPDIVQATTAFELAGILCSMGYIIRTGAATGIDERAMNGAIPELLEVIVPWEWFNKHLIPRGASVVIANKKLHAVWYESVDLLHPAPQRLSYNARHLHARNYGIVDGTVLVVALPNSNGTGGTGQGIRVANKLGIEVLQANQGTLLSPTIMISRVTQFLARRRAE